MGEPEGRGRRASSTSSLGREVRCACQFYQSDSLLPERLALAFRPSSRTRMVQTPPSIRRPEHCSEHEYEPIATPALSTRRTMKAPVVKITDTDVMPVADSDDSIDDPGRFQAAITLDGDLILPLDGQLEDSVMEGKELRHDGDTPEEEVETTEQFQNRLEENFRSVSEAQYNQTDQKFQKEPSASLKGGRSLQKLRMQAGKLRSRLKNIQRPTFVISACDKSLKRARSKPSSPSKTVEKTDKAESNKVSKMERLRKALPDRPKFNFPDRSKFHIKKPNIHFPSKLTHKAPMLRKQKRQRSNESTYGSQKNIFNFATMPRIFDRKTKDLSVTDSSRESQPESQNGGTFPRAQKTRSMSARWLRTFEDNNILDENPVPSAVERSRPWRHPSLEEPRLSFAVRQSDSMENVSERITWEEKQKKDEEESQETGHIEYEEKLLNLPIPKIEKEEIDPRLYGDQTVHEDSVSKSEEIESETLDPRKMTFPPIDSRNFGSEEEEVSLRSDREQQSSGSSSERRRHGVIEEIDSDEFFLRAKGISQEDMNMGRYLASEIRDALRGPMTNALEDVDRAPIPPERPKRTKSLRSRKEESVESSDVPPVRPKRERSVRRSQESFQNGSFAKHRIVYRADSENSREKSPIEPLDDIVVVKPVRRKSKTSLHSQQLQTMETSTPDISSPPVVPSRRKRAWLRTMRDKRATEPPSEIEDWPKVMNLQTSSSEPAIQKKFEDDEILMIDDEEEERYIEPVPIAPKRRSRSRGTSLARDEDRTSHGAESLPEVGYEEDDIPRDNESRDALPGYAIIAKREKPRPSPPRRHRRKFATVPRRPQRAYSTLAQVRPKASLEAAETMESILHPEPDELDHLSKIQGRPLPPPPRPPRMRRGRSAEPVSEVYASTQTDPLPDDVVIEEVTQAKLIVAPSRSGSQILISTERIPSPASLQTPPIPPLPTTQSKEHDVRDEKEMKDREEHLLEMALRTNEPLRIATLEVGDLKVDRLSVAQLEAYKIAASEIDAIVMSATEMSRKETEEEEEEKSLHPSLLRELLAIRSHLETVSGTIQSQEKHRTEDACTATSDEQVDVSGKEEDPVASKQTRDTKPTESQNPRHEVLQVTEKNPERPVRQSASPVRSLPPVISVTPDTCMNDAPMQGVLSTEVQPQRAVLSYTEDQFAVFPISRIPREFFSLRPFSTEETVSIEPSLRDSLRQLFEALRITGVRTMRHFVSMLENRIGRNPSEEKMREIELAICALLLAIAGLILVYVCTPHTVTHHHHWDFFNPPKG